eukprot:TRINITY_DN17883_c0_g1_i1.p1 TRINITY_DN17883_c0_g1~~TRINITY_DN17883_c0_g1_i1.p1  ORF type:complete len:125 (+),score=37.58 TRINITY_DN17883_c0_g1_i1:131-505(+)
MTATLRALGILALIYLAALTAGFLLYIGLIASPLLGSIPLLFYRGVVVAFIGALLLTVLMAIAARRIAALDLSTVIGAAALSLAFNISFLIVFPVTFDRSISMFQIGRAVQQECRDRSRMPSSA